MNANPGNAGFWRSRFHGTLFQAIDFIEFVNQRILTLDPAPRTGMRYVHATHQAAALTATIGASVSPNSAGYAHRTPVLSQRDFVAFSSAGQRAGGTGHAH